ncbi:MAG TPA: GFA family protein [Candidatus Cybelea sp.]|nr:GFA family protein [Candidatus Cybelea sp.]
MAELETTGHCLCGRTRYRGKGQPKWVCYCHCESCRRATGAPVTTFASFPLENFAFEGEAPARYHSTPGVTRTFCPNCGTPLTYEAEDLPGEIHLLVGSANHPEAAHLAPAYHVFEKERISWVDIGGALPKSKPKPAS